MRNPGNQLRVFTFDKETEKSTGVLTMAIFTLCLALSPLIFVSIADVGLTLVGYLIGEMTSIPISDGAIQDQLEIVHVWLVLTTCAAVVLVPSYGAAGLRQLLYAYALSEDGQLIKMKWKLRRLHTVQASVFARGFSKASHTNRSTTRQALNGIYAYFDGLDMMHNPVVVANHLSGAAVNAQIISIPLDNVTLVKRTRKKLVILADIAVKDQLKRKKMTIYWMYNNMDTLCQICERGSPVVNR